MGLPSFALPSFPAPVKATAQVWLSGRGLRKNIHILHYYLFFNGGRYLVGISKFMLLISYFKLDKERQGFATLNNIFIEKRVPIKQQEI